MTISSYSKLARTMRTLSLDSPKVIAERMTMLSRTGAGSSARDRAEISRMVVEKQSAAMESYLSLWVDASLHCHTFLFEFWTAFFSGNYARMAHSGVVSSSASFLSANRMLAPYQRRASANSRRFSRRVRAGGI